MASIKPIWGCERLHDGNLSGVFVRYCSVFAVILTTTSIPKILLTMKDENVSDEILIHNSL